MILEILASPLLGGITGFFSSWMKQKQELELLKERNSHEKNMAAIQTENRIKETKAQSDADDKKLDGEAFVAAQGSWKSALVSSVRIVISFYLLIWMTYLAYQLNTLTGGLQALEMTDIVDMYKHVIFGVLYLTVTCVCFWFGQRPSHAFKMMDNKTKRSLL